MKQNNPTPYCFAEVCAVPWRCLHMQIFAPYLIRMPLYDWDYFYLTFSFSKYLFSPYYTYQAHRVRFFFFSLFLFQCKKFLCSADHIKVCNHRNKRKVTIRTGIKLHWKYGTAFDSDEKLSEFCTVYKSRQ